MNKEPMQFDIAKPEQARWLAILLSELQSYGVKFNVHKDSSLVFVEID
jgi:hypothetical protein